MLLGSLILESSAHIWISTGHELLVLLHLLLRVGHEGVCLWLHLVHRLILLHLLVELLGVHLSLLLLIQLRKRVELLHRRHLLLHHLLLSRRLHLRIHSEGIRHKSTQDQIKN